MSADKKELDAIHKDLADDQIYVHPSLESQFSSDELAQIAENLADLDETVFVVAYPFASGDSYGGNSIDLLTRLHLEHPEPGVYIATTDHLEPTKYTDITLEAREWNEQGVSESWPIGTELSIVRLELPQDLGEAFVRTTELMQLPESELAGIEETAHEDWYEAKGIDPEAGSEGDGIDPTGLVVAGIVVAVVVGVTWKAMKLLRAAKRPAILPPSAVARIRRARDRQVDKQARGDVLALGELIDETEISRGSDAGSWQAALDHYEEARRIMDAGEVDVLDAVGAIVLSDRGTQALEAALAGRSFVPKTPCFLNPLHGHGPHQQKVELKDQIVTVPVCGNCRKALGGGKAPDILDVDRRGPKHYFETDAEPWASTGYGSLEPDLVTRLHGGR